MQILYPKLKYKKHKRITEEGQKERQILEKISPMDSH